MHVRTHGTYAEACEDTATKYKHKRMWAREVHRRGKEAGAGQEGCERCILKNLCFEEAYARMKTIGYTLWNNLAST